MVAQGLEEAFSLGLDRFGPGIDGEMAREGRACQRFQKEHEGPDTWAPKTTLGPSTGNRMSEGEWRETQ